ncbi:MAG: signal peptidase II [Lachnospiraceae bacterium]|nr:signal peptidase II [Lachnospiraceae bacterium]
MSRGKQLILFLLLPALVLLDQYTKHLAVLHLKEQPDVILIRGVVQLSYVENRGAAFGSMQNMQVLLIGLPVIVLCGIVYALWKMPPTRKYLPMFLVLLVLASGAMGNLIDRIMHAYVVDFIYFSLIDFPVFNVADIYVTCSAAVLILLMLFYYKDEDTAFLKRTQDVSVEDLPVQSSVSDASAAGTDLEEAAEDKAAGRPENKKDGAAGHE